MTPSAAPLISINDYLNEMKTWLDADIATYKNQFSMSTIRNPTNRTMQPGSNPPQIPPSHVQGYLSIPLSMSMLSAMEFCGYCLKGNWKNYSKSEKNIKRFFSFIHGHTTVTNPSSEEVRILIQSCRHGFAHRFFPKHPIDVGYLDYTNDLFDYTLGYTLNVYSLIQYVQQGLTYLLTKGDLFPSMQRCLDNYITHVENKIPVRTKWQRLKDWLKNLIR